MSHYQYDQQGNPINQSNMQHFGGQPGPHTGAQGGQHMNFNVNFNNQMNVQVYPGEQPINQNLNANSGYYMPNQPINHNMMPPPQTPLLQPQNMGGYTSSNQQMSSVMQPPESLIGEQPRTQACVFMRNIAYDCDDEELKKTLRTVGPYREMKMLIGDDNKSKGYGFCTYNDADTASSALRNLDKINVNSRQIHVSYASEQSSTNLKPEDAIERDSSEIIITKTGARSNVQSDIKVEEELLSPQTSTVDEMLRSLSSNQKEMLLFAIQDAYSHLGKKQGYREANQLVDALAQDENMLGLLEETYKSVFCRLKIEQGADNIQKNNVGLWHKNAPQQMQGRPGGMSQHGQ